MVKLVFAVALAAAALTVARDGHTLQRAGLLGSCHHVATPAGSWGEWWGCRAGKLTGAADLSTKSCTRMGTAVGLEYWRCPESLEQSRSTGT
jgi:hypothetical protein